jgi:hypothetical protein
VLAPLAEKLVLFGGTDFNSVFADTWTWDGTAWAQVSDAGPSGRSAATAAPLNGSVVLFGGTSGETGAQLSDTWTWDGTSWTQINVSGPSGRASAMMGAL